MPRKTLKSRSSKNTSDTNSNRIRQITSELIGNENSDDLMLKILDVLSETEIVPSVGSYYVFVYSPKTANIEYDAHPLVAVTDIFKWGFRGINFHWGETRQYTWQEILGSLHKVYPEEIKDLQAIPFGQIRINS
jgi:hypothetical protein